MVDSYGSANSIDIEAFRAGFYRPCYILLAYWKHCWIQNSNIYDTDGFVKDRLYMKQFLSIYM
jgi:hypothetical protein